eukprot:CAMPEP_0204826616 /NCGR_PEP_ID=MMETSP1346-20131115/4264_1 /ASSEMBLY_ACC=CAM_ASM_000771 /TAXON_ID=215587 /ORGANISM="Aplanochytrium stocchinoi, Strain GSBS06" /LENGTH=403 /DNA_ID=CAMNT_0051954711 /DNA_START=399 /DNA_END=1610 /DNA_ORIENTATION=-
MKPKSGSGKLKNSAGSNVYVTRHDSDYLVNGPKSRKAAKSISKAKAKNEKEIIPNSVSQSQTDATRIETVVSQLQKFKQPNLAVGDKTRVRVKLDASVSHDTFLFISGLVSNPKKAKDVFMSYYTLSLQNDRKRIQNFSMTKSQVVHARNIIQALPAFDRLRFQLCPSVLPDKAFWCIYFSLVQDKGRLGAPKEVDDVEVAETNGNFSCSKKYNIDENDDQSCGQDKWEEDMSNPDIYAGVKRERDDEMDESAFAEDIGIVSDFILKGAKKTLRFAEQLIETVDEKASAHLSFSLDSFVATGTGTSNSEKACDNKHSPKDNTVENTMADKNHIEPKNQESKRARSVNTRFQKKLDWKSVENEKTNADDGWSYVSVKAKGDIEVYDDSSISDLSEVSDEGFALV